MPGEFFKDESVESIEGNETSKIDFLTSDASVPTTLADVKKHMFQYARTNQWGRVESTWKAAFEVSSESEAQSPSSTLKPDYESYEWLIRSYSERIGNSQNAEIIFEKMKTLRSESTAKPASKGKTAPIALPMTAMAYTSFMLSLARDGRASKMFEVFKEMQSVQGLVWKDTDVRRLSQALHSSHLNASDFVKAVSPCIDAWSSTVKSRQKKGFDASISNLLHALKLEVAGYAVAKSLAHNDLTSANHYAASIIEDPNAMLFTKTVWHIAHWYIRKNQFSEARNFINQAALRDKPSRSQGHTKMGTYLAPRLAILMLELPLLQAANKTKTAEALLPQFYALFNTYAAYDAYAVAQFMVKTLYQYRLYDDLFEVVAYVESAIGSSVSLTGIFNLKLRAHVALDQSDEALKMLSKMQSEPLHAPNPRTSTYLISMAARLHGAHAAHDLLKSIIESVGIPHGTAFKAVVIAYCLESRVDEALHVLDLMDSKGLTVTWDHYEPVMELYERMNLLGKQFSLFNWLLTQRLARQPPSPSLTANLILSSIRQRYVNVAKAVARGAEVHHTALSAQLASALIVLHSLTRNQEGLAKLSVACQAKMSASGGESTSQRTRFGALAIRAYALLREPEKAQSAYDELKAAHLHQNVSVLNALLESYMIGRKAHLARDLLSTPGALELEFGPFVAHRAASDPRTATLRFRVFPKSPASFREMKAKWDKIVHAEFVRRAEAIEEKIAATKPATKVFNEAPEIVPDEAEQAALGDPEMVAEDELVNFEPEIQVAAASEEVEAAETAETSEPSLLNREAPPPRPSLYLALELLKVAHSDLDNNYEDVLKIIQDIRHLNLPPTMNQHTIHAQALVHGGRHFSLLKLLNRIYNAQFNMSRAFYHTLFRDITKVRKSRHVRHSLAVTVMNFMQRVKGDRSPAPTADTWHAYFICVAPSEVGIELEKFTKDAGHTITAETMDSITRMMILNIAPLHVAVHDAFVLFDEFQTRYGIYPSVQALTTLFSACMRSIVPNIYKRKFFLTLKKLNGTSPDTCKLRWTASDLEYALKEATSISSGQQKYTKTFRKSESHLLKSNTHEARVKYIESLLRLDFPFHRDAPTSVRGTDITAPIDLNAPFSAFVLNLTTSPLPKRGPPKEETEDLEAEDDEDEEILPHPDEERERRLLLIKRLRLLRQSRDPKTAALLAKALIKFRNSQL